MYMPSNPIDVKVVGAIGTIVLNRPDNGNALARAMVEELIQALDDLYLERRVRAIILTGAGGEFCVGADLGEMKTSQEAGVEESQSQWGADAAEFRDLLVRMLEITKPIIAAVSGQALGAGAALVAACDIAVASDDANFGLPDVRQGLVAGLAAPLLNFRLGAGQTARLLLSGQPLDAAEAHRIGVFHELTPPEMAWARAAQIADQCAEGAPEAIQLSKRLIYETLGEHLATQLAAAAAMEATARTTESAEEGVAAALEGRPPIWR
jgi:enoyl-CoA hydratase/carnithine racemase